MKLKIVVNNEEVTLRYEELEQGDVFLKGGFLYVRCNNRTECVQLSNGNITTFPNEHRVYPVDAEVTWRTVIITPN